MLECEIDTDLNHSFGLLDPTGGQYIRTVFSQTFFHVQLITKDERTVLLLYKRTGQKHLPRKTGEAILQHLFLKSVKV